MPDIELPTLIVGIAIGVYVLYRLFVSARSRLRRRTRDLKGVRAEAEVVGVSPLAPPQRTEHAVRLRFVTPAGQEYFREFPRGFGGIVPVQGWRVTVLFDPDDPENAEIVDNPYLHPVAGAPAPKEESPVRGVVQTAMFTVIVVAMVVLFLFREWLGDAENLVFGGMFAVAGLLVLILSMWTWRDQKGLRTAPEHAVATVTHSWEEWTRQNPGSSTNHRMISVYPYTVLFQLPDGRQVHRRAPMATSTTRYAPGQQVDVSYDPSAPTEIAVGRNGNSAKAPVLGLLVGVVFTAVGVGIMLYA
ncbi:DUF3592 domain-containing protein [Nocardiopsis suaedae]|uniref:DUF3592 domain-containing protein n=1 Tax=Nocardiopsis suaedae TaxID=3018444 RepID=A0ABT4TV20_9ACTN|nr:DUF3592 domain-containing protein [Nocardiopsis suaedae]MDA2808554.1 DUF3592 domain-containing protein [Nocardiopsis suaedae]